jgi:alpha/beta superfamily hydrolase
MDNKVVQAMVRAFQGLGVAVVRFNFRGVGLSTGEYAHGMGELNDLYTVLDWIHTRLQPETYWVGGFSFGSWVAAKAAVARPDQISRLLMIAPPVQYPDFQEVHPPQRCTVMIAEQDEIVTPEAIHHWIAQRHRTFPIRSYDFKETSHFFHGQLTTLRTCIEEDFRAP